MKIKTDIDQKMDAVKTVGIGLFAAMLIMIVSTAGISFATVNGSVDESLARFLLVLTQTLSVFIGCFIAQRAARKNALLINVSVLAGYLSILFLINAVIFGADYRSITQSGFAVILGAAIAYLLQYRRKGREKHGYRKGKW